MSEERKSEVVREDVVDDDVQAIIDQAEAGIGDLITAYEPIERVYFNATHVSGESVTYSTDSTTR